MFERILAGTELGPVLLEWLADPAPVADVVSTMQRAGGGDGVDARTMLLLHLAASRGRKPGPLDALRGEPGVDAPQRPHGAGGPGVEARRSQRGPLRRWRCRLVGEKVM